MPELLLATSNPGKIREYRFLLDGLGYQVTSLSGRGISEVVVETGHSYEQNARLKAITYAGLSRCITLADDSGLEVDALHGEPGLHSARFAGEAATDEERVSRLLARLDGVPWDDRAAHFRCVIVIVTPHGTSHVCRGDCHGMIAFEPRGDSGFGYDPVFYLPEIGTTMAELPLETKNQVSHRARASQQARQVLLHLCST
jgi:XTP/dITP diphosphohydrolase